MSLTAAIPFPPHLLGTQELLGRAMGRVEQRFDQALKSDLPPVQALVRHVERYRGKMLRPALVVLSGQACLPGGIGADPGESHITIAAVCEMIHMATLVHDDVLDEADIRRKGATVNRLRGNEAAVILGDYLFSSAYRLCATLDSQHAALLIGQTGMTLCAGELLQLHHRENLSIDQATYFEIVKRKTGSLISIACRLGAMQAGADEPTAERLAEFGMKLGVAFQIQDDLLDLTGNQQLVGKPLHRDLQLGKLTLPVIHHLESAEAGARMDTLTLLREAESRAGAAGADDAADAQRLVRALESTRSLEFAGSAARGLVQAAKALISPLPNSAAKDLLMLMADQVIDRSF